MKGYTFYADRPAEPMRKTDVGLVVATVLLWGLGLVNLYVCTPATAARLFDGDRYYFVVRQLLSSAVGGALMVFFALIPMERLRRMLPYLVIGTLFLCLLTFIPGVGIVRNGARRWIRIPHVATFQPSEVAKFSVVLFLANLFDRQYVSGEYEGDAHSFLKPLGGLLLFVAVVFLQKDLSTGILIFLVGASLFFVSGARFSWFFPLLVMGALVGALLIASERYRLLRVITFLRPDEFDLSTRYQLGQSEKAIISGGVWGQGMGSGLTRVSAIPEVQTDYIFAGWTASMGLLGVTAYFVLLAFFAWRAYAVAFTTPDRFAAFGTFGCATMIVAQSLVNCAVVCGALPTTGIPLPFFSSGGSSLIATLCMCGFMCNASRCDGPSSGRASHGFTETDFEMVVER